MREQTRSMDAKFRLVTSIGECMKQYPLEDITVDQVARGAGLSRQTFYRHFRDKYDLINWYFDKLLLESFDEMGESYMRKVYENVKGFKTTNVAEKNDSLIVEGLITFESGKQKKTQFIFENARQTKRGKVVLEGINKTFSDSKKSFVLKGSVVGKKYISESMIYSYKTQQLNESNDSEVVKVHGRVKRK